MPSTRSMSRREAQSEDSPLPHRERSAGVAALDLDSAAAAHSGAARRSETAPPAALAVHQSRGTTAAVVEPRVSAVTTAAASAAVTANAGSAAVASVPREFEYEAGHYVALVTRESVLSPKIVTTSSRLVDPATVCESGQSTLAPRSEDIRVEQEFRSPRRQDIRQDFRSSVSMRTTSTKYSIRRKIMAENQIRQAKLEIDNLKQTQLLQQQQLSLQKKIIEAETEIALADTQCEATHTSIQDWLSDVEIQTQHANQTALPPPRAADDCTHKGRLPYHEFDRIQSSPVPHLKDRKSSLHFEPAQYEQRKVTLGLRPEQSTNQDSCPFEPERRRRDPQGKHCLRPQPAFATEPRTYVQPGMPLVVYTQPPLDLPVFSGEHNYEWPLFKAKLESLCEKLSEVQILEKLNKSLKGQARECLGALLFSTGNLDVIVKKLEQKFGDVRVTLKHLLSDIRNMRPLPERVTSQDISDYHTKILSVVNTLSKLNNSSNLVEDELLNIFVSKLPAELRCSWTFFRQLNCDAPAISVFALFMEQSIALYRASGFAPSVDLLTSEPRKSGPHRVLALDNSTRDKEEKRLPVVESPNIAEKQEIRCQCCKSEKHKIKDCERFLKLKVDDRWEIIKNNNMCFRCLWVGHLGRNCRSSRSSRAHILLQRPSYEQPLPQVSNPKHSDSRPPANRSSESSTSKDTSPNTRAFVGNTDDGDGSETILLPTLYVIAKGPTGEIRIPAQIDTGSTLTLIDHQIAERLGLRGVKRKLHLAGVANMSHVDTESQTVELEIRSSTRDRSFKIQARTVSHVLAETPLQLKKQVWPQFNDISIETPVSEAPKLLLGHNHWDLIKPTSYSVGRRGEPSAMKTGLGWVLHGHIDEAFRTGETRAHSVLHVGTRNDCDLGKLDDLVRQHFSLENMGITLKPRGSDAGKRELEILEKTSKKTDTQWETGLLWKENEVSFPPSRRAAENRLRTLEIKFQKDKEYEETYRRKMQSYIEKGYARKLTEVERVTKSDKTFFLPHFAVRNPNKPGKLRIVFDCASKVSGVSLNSKLSTGPDLYSSLLGCIFRFREGKYAFTSDIEEMFLRIRISQEDQQAQRFLWRENSTKEVSEYVMTSMLFGAACSPCSAQYIRNVNATQSKSVSEEAVQAVTHSFYMDDWLESCDDLNQGKSLIREVLSIHRDGGFKLTSWSANEADLLEMVPASDRNTGAVSLATTDADTTVRTLGLLWNPAIDMLTFDLTMKKLPTELVIGEKKPTKRQMLAMVMSVFDPAGLLGALTVRSKILLQDVWRSGVQWDEEIADELYAKWRLWLQQVDEVRKVEIPRHYFSSIQETPKTRELHVFCDASTSAFAAVAYFRSEYDCGKIVISFVGSKSRVAPLRPISVPRLELQGALLASRFAECVRKEHRTKIDRLVMWTDSTNVLYWIRSDARNFQTFVSHRLGEIDELVGRICWRWVPTKLNVADEATRDSSDVELGPNSRWLTGPSFLHEPEEAWPQQPESQKGVPKNIDLEIRKNFVLAVIEKKKNDHLPEISRFSSYTKLINATCYVLIFIRKCRKQPARIDSKMYKEAERLWFKSVQEDSFSAEIESLSAGKFVEKRSRLFQLSPVLIDGLIRTNGRVKNEEIDFNMRYPIILDYRSNFTSLLANYFHRKLGHHGTEMIVNEMRQNFCIPNLRQLVKKISRDCRYCTIRRTKPTYPVMGALPVDRTTPFVRPFTNCGMDYFGPIMTTTGRRKQKYYGVLFTCLTTRAIHIEIAPSLSTDDTIKAIQRFVGRRGYPSIMISDNGSNLRSADKELRKNIESVDYSKIEQRFRPRHIEWKFNVPASPHSGGVWERLIRSVKKALSVILHEQAPHPDTLYTLLVEVERIINSRPLTHVSLDNSDEEALTPNHFLLGTSSAIYAPLGTFDRKDLCLRKQWRIAQYLADKFWQRWLKEYLPSLVYRPKWHVQQRQMQLGDVVILVDEQAPRNVWRKGVVTKLHPAKDGVVRVVEVKTSNGTLKRSVHKLMVIYENNV